MTAGAPWSVKGIDPKAREVAKGLARRAGMTLGEWLNRVILEDDVPEEITSEAQFGARDQRRAGGAPAPVRSDDLGRVVFALDRLTDRIEASETRTGLAISGVEHSVRHAVARIETAEREHLAVAGRVDAVAERLEAEQARAAERLRRMEAETSGPRSAEALRALEQAVSRVADHLRDGEDRTRGLLTGLEARIARAEAFTGGDPTALVEEVVDRLGARLSVAESNTTDALESLRVSLSALDDRIHSVEGGGDGARPDLDRRLEALGDQLARKVEDARSEMADRLAASAPGQVDTRLNEITRQIAAVEQRSARAIEAMGREVLTMAEMLNRRVQGAEQRGAEAIEQVGGEIARIAGTVESRLGRVDQLHADALERLGSEIGRITDGLTERIVQSERRAAQAIDDVGEQVSKVTERIEQRHERASTDLAERIRQSEARTARLLEEARLRFEGRTARSAETSQAAEADCAPAVAAVFGPALFSRAEPVSQPALDPGNPAFGHEDFEAADSFMPILESDDDDEVVLSPEAMETLEAEPPQLSTREVIEQARAAARAAAATAADIQPQMDALAVAGDRRRRAPRGGLFGMLKPGRPTSTWQTALMVAGGAAFLSVGAAGVVLTEGAGARRTASATEAPIFSPRASVALAPQTLIAPGFPPVGHAQPGKAAGADYGETIRAVEQREPGALSRLKAMADAGHTPAQIYLAKLYEGGHAGVTENLPEARRWITRAADAGDASAMHGLALYYFRGEGGPQDATEAAQWFRKAAERGMVDSQYNLALLYESGSGVARDPAQAYKWFSIAARSGDTEARTKAKVLADTLSAPQLAAAESAARNFQPTAQLPRQAEAPSGMSLADARKILDRLGYYQAAPSGSPSHDLQLAVAAYQRDQGLAATGALDPATLSRLAVFTR
jgi:localization factor PodJL